MNYNSIKIIILFCILSILNVQGQVQNYIIGTNKLKGINLEKKEGFSKEYDYSPVDILINSNGDALIIVKRSNTLIASNKSQEYPTVRKCVCRYCGKISNTFSDSYFTSYSCDNYSHETCEKRKYGRFGEDKHIFIDSCVKQFDKPQEWTYSNFKEASFPDLNSLEIQIGGEMLYASFVKVDNEIKRVTEYENTLVYNETSWYKKNPCERTTHNTSSGKRKDLYVYKLPSSEFVKLKTSNIKSIKVSDFSWRPEKKESFDYNTNKTVDLSYKSSKDVKLLFMFKAKK